MVVLFFNFYFLFLVVLGHHCLIGLFLVVVNGGYSLVTVPGLLAYLIVQLIKNPPAMQETPVQLLGWVYLREKG